MMDITSIAQMWSLHIVSLYNCMHPIDTCNYFFFFTVGGILVIVGTQAKNLKIILRSPFLTLAIQSFRKYEFKGISRIYFSPFLLQSLLSKLLFVYWPCLLIGLPAFTLVPLITSTPHHYLCICSTQQTGAF